MSYCVQYQRWWSLAAMFVMSLRMMFQFVLDSSTQLFAYLKLLTTVFKKAEDDNKFPNW